MTARWAFVPSAPLLACHGDDALADVRSAALEATRAVTQHASPVTVLAREHADTDERAGGSLAPYGLAVRAGGSLDQLGLGHTIGAWLLDTAGWTGPRRYVGRLSGEERSLLVVADGCACVDESSPRGFDPRGAKLQDQVVDALVAADTRWLAELDLALSTELWCTGAPVLRHVASTVGERDINTMLRYSDAPLGVGYWVVDWHLV